MAWRRYHDLLNFLLGRYWREGEGREERRIQVIFFAYPGHDDMHKPFAHTTESPNRRIVAEMKNQKSIFPYWHLCTSSNIKIIIARWSPARLKSNTDDVYRIRRQRSWRPNSQEVAPHDLLLLILYKKKERKKWKEKEYCISLSILYRFLTSVKYRNPMWEKTAFLFHSVW